MIEKLGYELSFLGSQASAAYQSLLIKQETPQLCAHQLAESYTQTQNHFELSN